MKMYKNSNNGSSDFEALGGRLGQVGGRVTADTDNVRIWLVSRIRK